MHKARWKCVNFIEKNSNECYCKEVSCALFPVRLAFYFISIGQAWQVQRGVRCFLLPQTSKSEFVEAFKNINLGIFRKDKKKTIFKKWKWGSFSADQLQSAGSLTSCVSQRQLIFFFIFVFLSDNNFSCNYKNFGNCNREALLEVDNVQGIQKLCQESDLAPLFHPLSAFSLKETTLSGWKWFQKVSGKRSNHAPVHDIE